MYEPFNKETANDAPKGVELLACPCGAEVDPSECPYPTRGALFKITCSSDDCGWCAYGVSPSDVTRVWNRRTNVEASVAPILAERDAYKVADESMQQAHYEACVRAREAEARAERLAEALRLLTDAAEEILQTHPKAVTYPDGPCLEKYSRLDLQAAVEKAHSALTTTAQPGETNADPA